MQPSSPPCRAAAQFNKIAGANRRWRGQFRCRGSRRESAVAQLFLFGISMHLVRCHDQKSKTLDEFYKEIGEHDGAVDREIGKTMLSLLARLRALPDEPSRLGAYFALPALFAFAGFIRDTLVRHCFCFRHA